MVGWDVKEYLKNWEDEDDYNLDSEEMMNAFRLMLMTLKRVGIRSSIVRNEEHATKEGMGEGKSKSRGSNKRKLRGGKRTHEDDSEWKIKRKHNSNKKKKLRNKGKRARRNGCKECGVNQPQQKTYVLGN